MSRAEMKIKGHLSRDPELAETASGTAVLSLSVPHTPRRKNRDSGEWEDAGPTLWVQAAIWGDDARLYAPLVRKGTLVQIEGEPTLRQWESDGKSGVNLEMKHASVALFPRRPRGGEQVSDRTTVADDWYTAPVPGEDEPF